jgi:hypothetical protein
MASADGVVDLVSAVPAILGIGTVIIVQGRGRLTAGAIAGAAFLALVWLIGAVVVTVCHQRGHAYQ